MHPSDVANMPRSLYIYIFFKTIKWQKIKQKAVYVCFLEDELRQL